MPPARPSVKVFISYAHADQKMHQELVNHLGALRNSQKITIWWDQEIPPGANWRDQIDTHIDQADLILFLLSADFIASNYCWNHEVQVALKRHEAGEVQVIPVLLKPVDWQDTPFEKLQILPTGAIAVTEVLNHDATYRDIARGIRRVVDNIQKKLEDGSVLDRTPVEEGKPQPPGPLSASTTVKQGLADVPAPVSTPVEEEESIAPNPLSASTPVKQGLADASAPVSTPINPAKRLTQLVSRRQRLIAVVIIVALVVTILVPALNEWLHKLPGQVSAISHQSISVTTNSSVHKIQIVVGISDGSNNFSFSWPQPGLLQQDANAYSSSNFFKLSQSYENSKNNPPGSVDPNGEACIYDQNGLIIGSYVTVVAVVSLSDTDHWYSFGLGNATLQGLCLKQRSYNQDSRNRTKVRILVANIGGQDASILQTTMPIIVCQLTALASHDRTFLGVVGFSFSASLYYNDSISSNQFNIDTMHQLEAKGIPIIATAAESSGVLFDDSGTLGFLRINSGNAQEAEVAAEYASSKEKENVYILYDSESIYNASLEIALYKAFENKNIKSIGEDVYNTKLGANNPDYQSALDDIKSRIPDSTSGPSDMIYCACVASSVSPNLNDIYTVLQNPSLVYRGIDLQHVMWMGADGLYNPEGNLISSNIVYQDMFFTSFAFPDKIADICNKNTHCTAEEANFKAIYCQAFDREDPCGHIYGLSRPAKSTLLAYDALTTLLMASQLSDPASPPYVSVHKALVSGKFPSFQGVTGWLSWMKPSSNPLNKMILVLQVGSNGTAGVCTYRGVLTQPSPSTPSTAFTTLQTGDSCKPG